MKINDFWNEAHTCCYKERFPSIALAAFHPKSCGMFPTSNYKGGSAGQLEDDIYGNKMRLLALQVFDCGERNLLATKL